MRYGRLNLVPAGWSRRFVIGRASDMRNTHLRDRAPRVGEALSLSSVTNNSPRDAFGIRVQRGGSSVLWTVARLL